MNLPSKTSTEDVSKYIRSDVSLAVLLTVIAGFVGGVVVHWTYIPLTFALAYLAVGLSTVYEWNNELVSEGVAPREPFSNLRSVSFLPAGLVVVGLHFRGAPFAVSGTASLVLLVLYLYSLYAVGFRNLDSDEVYFEPDPYGGEEKVWREDVYIPRLERWSVEQAESNDE